MGEKCIKNWKEKMRKGLKKPTLLINEMYELWHVQQKERKKEFSSTTSWWSVRKRNRMIHEKRGNSFCTSQGSTLLVTADIHDVRRCCMSSDYNIWFPSGIKKERIFFREKKVSNFLFFPNFPDAKERERSFEGFIEANSRSNLWMSDLWWWRESW